MKPLMRIGICVLPSLALSVACARSPDVGKFTCTSSAHCPSDYSCTGSPGYPGRCVQTAAAVDAVTPTDSPQISPPVDAIMPVDNPQTTADLDAATYVDSPGAAHDAADVSIAIPDGDVGGSGGTATVPGTGGAGGSGGIAGATGGAFDGGGQGGGGVGGALGTGGTIDASPAAGTGGKGSGGSQTGGVLGTGGAAPPGTGGTTLPGTGGRPGTGGSTPPGTGGRPGTGGSIPPGTGGFSGVTVQLDKTHQTIQGFGINVALMPGSLGSSTVGTLYGTSGADALGLSIMRIGMNSNGSLSGSSSDISAAKSAGAKIIGTTWSAPANCKSNGNTMDGGYLLESCYETWSTTIANFAQQQGLYAMSIANESDFASCPGVPVCTDSYDTMTFTAKQMVAFLKLAGPKLRAKNIKVIAPEASEWLHVWSNLSATGSLVASYPNSSDPHNCGCFSNTITAAKEATCAPECLNGDGYDYGHWLWNDQEAWNAFDILGVHEYDSQIAYAWPADVNAGTRDREVWQTQMSGVMHWPEEGPSNDIDNGVAVAGWIHSALTVGEASAWLYWWYQAYYFDDNEGLLLKGSTAKTKRYYTLGNYSKFVRPGYKRVGVAGSIPTDVLLSAYKDTDGTVVVAAINQGTAPASVPIAIAGGTAPASCTPHVTSADDDLIAKAAVSVNGGAFTAALAGATVTTFVCK
ncbi:MAG: hypothetical protein JXP73_16275 [Deltaproteobacteria bacterium]|nr:hypothetical protein [Deltaproteobacteria bacterium]